MARLDVKTQNPERYAQVKAEQEELKNLSICLITANID